MRSWELKGYGLELTNSWQGKGKKYGKGVQPSPACASSNVTG